MILRAPLGQYDHHNYHHFHPHYHNHHHYQHLYSYQHLADGQVQIIALTWAKLYGHIVKIIILIINNCEHGYNICPGQHLGHHHHQHHNHCYAQ